MLKIRLQRIGKRGQAYFKVVVTEHTRKPKGKYLELLGSYDPHKNEINVDAEKIKYWLGHGAKMSPTVNNLLVGRGVIEGEKVRVWKPKPQKRGTETEVQKKVEATETKPAEVKEEEKDKSREEAKAEEPTAETPPLHQTGLEAGQTPKEETKTEEPTSTPAETPAVQ